jgi:hypothetical protein
MRSRGFSFIASLALAAALASCATPGLYQPADNREGGAGYTEARLSDAAWRVEFIGDDFTSRETVETYLLYRAAELTAENGFDWFVSSTPAVSEETEIIVEAVRAEDYQARYWNPRWRRRSRFFWSDLDPVGPIPREPREPHVWNSVHYSASAEIRLGRGAIPEGAFDARQTLAQFESSIVRP